ncbi:MAG: hypothetical protein M1546_05670 [Chloroflexi bacterium]|nr:hypothetical protein [Chloroflexota bacterium]
MHTTGKMDWDDLMSERHYDAWGVYRQSKLADLLFTFELNRRLAAKGATTKAIAAHPGLAATRWPENNLTGFQRWMMKTLTALVSQSAAMGALPLLYAAVDPNAKAGCYYGPEHDQRGYPVEVRAGDAAYDEADAKRLWERDEALTGVEYEVLAVQS